MCTWLRSFRNVAFGAVWRSLAQFGAVWLSFVTRVKLLHKSMVKVEMASVIVKVLFTSELH